ncbi:hypothetical protein LJC59_05790 [Desulfovibrio sp. OttesenSCG-928-A18]|nr:hypothetical protein [Desulfovibrio sp. OttesenSCG-928-A18]
MEKDAKEALQVTKEIVVKFIETSRVSPTNFAEIFPSVYRVVLETITRPGGPATGSPAPGRAAKNAAKSAGEQGE